MLKEDVALIVVGCGLLAAILSYLAIYIYRKRNNKIEKWRAGILLVDYIFLTIIINSIIVAVITPILVTNSNTITASILSICIFGGINAFISLYSSKFKKKGKKFLLHFAIAIIILTILSIIGLKGINIPGIAFMILAIFNLYYYKTLKLIETIPVKKLKLQNQAIKLIQEKKYNNVSNNNNIFYIIVISILVVAIITLFIIIIIFNNKYNQLSKNYDEIENKLNIAEEESAEYLIKALEYKEKADFLNNNIVFVLEGYGNVYYTYDCVKKITGNEEYRYWAYNQEAAISKGFKKAKC